MANKQNGGVLSFLADLGRTIEEYLANPLIMILIIIIAWINHVIGALILTLLVIGIHLRKKASPKSPQSLTELPPPPSVEKSSDNGFVVLIGVVILIAGFYWLLKDLFPLIEVPWSIALIMLGVVFLILGIKSGRK